MDRLAPGVAACPFPHRDRSGTQGLDDWVTAKPTRHTHLKGCRLHPMVTWELHLILALLSTLGATFWVTTFILYSWSLFWTQTLGIQEAWVSGNRGSTRQGAHPISWPAVWAGLLPADSSRAGPRLAARLAFSRAPSLLVAGAKAGRRRSVTVGWVMSGWLTVAPSQLPMTWTPRPEALCVPLLGTNQNCRLPAGALLPWPSPSARQVGASTSRRGPQPATECVWVDRHRAPCRGAPPAPPD